MTFPCGLKGPNWPPRRWRTMINPVHPMFNPYGVAGTTYGQDQCFHSKKPLEKPLIPMVEMWKTIEKPSITINLSTFFAICSTIIFFHLHLISSSSYTLSHSHPPTTHLPPPSPGWSKPLISQSAYTNGQWTVEWDNDVFRILCIFHVLTYVKWLDINFILEG